MVCKNDSVTLLRLDDGRSSFAIDAEIGMPSPPGTATQMVEISAKACDSVSGSLTLKSTALLALAMLEKKLHEDFPIVFPQDWHPEYVLASTSGKEKKEISRTHSAFEMAEKLLETHNKRERTTVSVRIPWHGTAEAAQSWMHETLQAIGAEETLEKCFHRVSSSRNERRKLRGNSPNGDINPLNASISGMSIIGRDEEFRRLDMESRRIVDNALDRPYIDCMRQLLGEVAFPWQQRDFFEQGSEAPAFDWRRRVSTDQGLSPREQIGNLTAGLVAIGDMTPDARAQVMTLMENFPEAHPER